MEGHAGSGPVSKSRSALPATTGARAREGCAPRFHSKSATCFTWRGSSKGIMQIHLTCMRCTFEFAPHSGGFHAPILSDNRCYDFTCPRGHRCRIIVQQPRFEILFELSLNAIIDGYYREAVSSASASAERTYEIFSRLLFLQSARNKDDFNTAWRIVRKFSERQVGFFVCLWAEHMNELPELPTNSMVELRNSVIHQGRFPTRDEAVSYLEKQFQQIEANLKKLESLIPRDQMAWDHEFFETAFSQIGDVANTTLSISTIFNASRNGEVRSVEEYLENVRKMRVIFNHAKPLE